jgi:hypothetical protein
LRRFVLKSKSTKSLAFSSIIALLSHRLAAISIGFESNGIIAHGVDAQIQPRDQDQLEENGLFNTAVISELRHETFFFS